MDSGPVGNEDQGVKGVVVVGGTTTSSTSNFLCRQSSTRWTPTTDQIRILKDLYYNNGVRSPTAEQIQRISAKLRQYGKIEGKNVFYWFQNHKARERQKKRFTTTTTDHFNNVHCYRPPPSGPGFLWNNNNNNNVNDHEYHHLHPVYNNKFPSTFQAGGSSTGYFNGGSMCNNGYGSMAMERSFRERSMGYNIRHREEEEEDEEHSVAHHQAIETLPLFPMHDEIKHQTSNDYYFNSYGINAINGSGCHDWQYNRDLPVKQTATCPRASLELTLNSNGFANLNN